MLYVSTDEGVYVDSNGKPTKDIQLQWGEVPSSIGKFIYSIYFPVMVLLDSLDTKTWHHF